MTDFERVELLFHRVWSQYLTVNDHDHNLISALLEKLVDEMAVMALERAHNPPRCD